MWLRTIEEKMEEVRSKMEDAAIALGLGHQKVYQLSRELDLLHNLWEKEQMKIKADNRYRINPNSLHVKENSNIPIYKIVV